MTFITLGGDFVRDGYTQVDNIYLLSYLPVADGTDVKIYLYGMSLAKLGTAEENTVGNMARCLSLSEERILKGFSYWEERGLVLLSKAEPRTVKYLSVKHPVTPVVKYNTEKYKIFSEELARLFPEVVLQPNDYERFFELMTAYKIEINAMLLLVQYCSDLKGGKVSVSYLYAVAADWAKRGLVTEKKVNAHIIELENNNESIRMLFETLGLKRMSEIEDRQLYLKWTEQLGFLPDAVLTAARAMKKKGGMERLDRFFEELSAAEAKTAVEVAEYTAKKDAVYQLTVELSKTLGTYYGNLDMVIETYSVPWLGKGFKEGTLLKIAKFCFLRGIRGFDGMDQLVGKFYQLGLLSEEAIDAHIARQVQTDENIRKILDAANIFGTVNQTDRERYRTWLSWGFEDDAILYAAAQFQDKPFPMQSLNKLLSRLHNFGRHDRADIEKELAKGESGAEKRDTFMQREYTEEQLKNVLRDFDKWEN